MLSKPLKTTRTPLNSPRQPNMNKSIVPPRAVWFFWLCRWPFLYFQATCLPQTLNSRHRRRSAAKMPPADPTRLFPPGFHTSFLAVEASWEQRTRSYVALSGADELPSSSDRREGIMSTKGCAKHTGSRPTTQGGWRGYRWSVGCLGRPSILPSPTAAPSPPTTTSPTFSTSTIPPSKPGTFPTEPARSLDSRRLFFGSPHPRLVCVMGHSRELCGLL